MSRAYGITCQPHGQLAQHLSTDTSQHTPH